MKAKGVDPGPRTGLVAIALSAATTAAAATTGTGESMLLCHLGLLKSGVQWMLAEMQTVLVLISAGSMLALGGASFLGLQIKVGQWSSALLALCVGASGTLVAGFFVSLATLPCEVTYSGASGAGTPVAPTSISNGGSTTENRGTEINGGNSVNVEDPMKGPDGTEKNENAEETADEEDLEKDPALSLERHPDEIELDEDAWAKLSAEIDTAEDAAAEKWMRSMVDRWLNTRNGHPAAQISYRRVEDENGKWHLVIKRYYNQGTKQAPQWNDTAQGQIYFSKVPQ